MLLTVLELIVLEILDAIILIIIGPLSYIETLSYLKNINFLAESNRVNFDS
ncbi:hypothetical protein [Coxiella endosymbiont of Rhipicephalus microplus]|uniref:hypothetical protein n=1 Tax=Coxiella endosymbiont of Rhipicephalus microplus TaxID=1656186 RepID=UPI0015D0CDDB|nr:hypothetical protein [Coxiella endosymbiont of Rhipicephalus microplus]